MCDVWEDARRPDGQCRWVFPVQHTLWLLQSLRSRACAKTGPFPCSLSKLNPANVSVHGLAAARVSHLCCRNMDTNNFWMRERRLIFNYLQSSILPRYRTIPNRYCYYLALSTPPRTLFSPIPSVSSPLPPRTSDMLSLRSCPNPMSDAVCSLPASDPPVSRESGFYQATSDIKYREWTTQSRQQERKNIFSHSKNPQLRANQLSQTAVGTA